MKQIILACFLLIGLMVSCQGSGKKLGYLGPREAVNKTIDGKHVDTLYFQIPDFAFMSHDSIIITQADVKGKIYVADFFFTSCPDICPKMKTQMKRVWDVYKDRKDFMILSHSIDPKHDSVRVLKEFADRLGVDKSCWKFLTGDKETIYDLAQTGYFTTAVSDDKAPGGIAHSGYFSLIDKNRNIRGMYDGTDEDAVNRLIADIEILYQEYQNEN